MRREVEEVNDAVFAELTYHAAYDPQRAIRTRRHKYVRRYGERDLPVLANVDDSPTKDLLLDGPVAAPEGAELNGPDQISPAEPANGHVLDPAGSVH